MAIGRQGPPGPQGLQGPQGLPAIADPVQAADALSSQSTFLNRLAMSVTSNPNLAKNVAQQILQSPMSISNNLADNQIFQSIIANNLVNSSTVLGQKVAEGIVNDPLNTSELAAALGSQGNLILQLSENLSNPILPYRNYLKGPSGDIANLKASLQPIGLLCDTMGNCKTPQFGSYLNFTNGNLLFNNNKGTASFRVAGNGDAWITGFSGGQLGTYDDNTETGTVALKWDAQGNVIMGDIMQTSANLKVGGNVYMRNSYANGFLANKTINVDTVDNDGYAQLYMHGGMPGSDSGSPYGSTGTTDGSTFEITKNGPSNTTNVGGKNAVVFNNFNNHLIFGDTTEAGNIFMSSNNSNMDAISQGKNWVNTITGNTNSTSGNNAAIINNTGTMGSMSGSLMFVGNAAGGSTDRIVTVKDKLQIGDWQIYDLNGDLRFDNTKDPTQTVILNNNLSTNKGVVNGMTIGNQMINGLNFSSGISGATDINASSVSAGNISATNFKGGDFNGDNINLSNVLRTGSSKFRGTMHTNNVRYEGKVSGNSVDVVHLFSKDIKVNNSINSANDDLWFRSNWVDARGEFYKFTGVKTKTY